MKILVTARQLSLDKTSEGICSSKFILALSRAGHQVSCLTSDDIAGTDPGISSVPWLDSVRVKHIKSYGHDGAWTRWSRLTESLAAGGNPGAYAGRKIDAAIVYATGYRPHYWRQVDLWYRALRQEVEAEKPDLIFVRAAGQEFEPHMAMLRWHPPVPWIANYHDPYPVSLYPSPYGHRYPLISRWQESVHRKILTAANALTFPSRRLLEWVLRDDLEQYRDKAFVIPHLATELPGAHPAIETIRLPVAKSGDFNIVHTGTLLGHRDPRVLLRGFSDFIRDDGEKRDRAHLVFVGGVIGENRQHLTQGKWSHLIGPDNLVCLDQRINYHRALEIAKSAVALVILEASAAESPFFPAKLADYLWLRKPILALSPGRSVVTDTLGPDYQLRVAPDDSRGVTSALSALWASWTAGRVSELTPPQSVLDSMSEEAVLAQLECVFDHTLAGLSHRH
jgi:hypothetical protein